MIQNEVHIVLSSPFFLLLYLTFPLPVKRGNLHPTLTKPVIRLSNVNGLIKNPPLFDLVLLFLIVYL